MKGQQSEVASSVSLQDLMSAYILQNSLPAPAEACLHSLPADLAITVMRKALDVPPGADVVASFMRRVRAVAGPLLVGAARRP